jgi:hypothetical protein
MCVFSGIKETINNQKTFYKMKISSLPRKIDIPVCDKDTCITNWL